MVFDIKTDLRVQYENPSGTWNSIQTDTYDIDIDRGLNIEKGVFARPDVGTAIVRLSKRSLSDLLTTPAYKSNQNFRIQYYDGTTWQSIFSGIIQNVAMNYVAETKKLDITITANDLMKILLNTRLSLYTVSGSATARSFRNVMASLGSAVNAIDSRVTLSQWLSQGSGTTQTSAAWEDTTAGEVLTKFLDAELGLCWATKDSNLIRYATRNDVNYIQGYPWNESDNTISNNHSTSYSHVCMDYMDLSYDSDAIVNKVKVTDPLTTLSYTATNSSSVTAYGEQSGDFEVEFDGSGISSYTTWATAVATAASPKSIKSVSCPAIRRDGRPSSILLTDIAQNQQVEFVAEGYTTLQEIYLITRIGHTINSDHWEMTLGLWKGI